MRAVPEAPIEEIMRLWKQGTDTWDMSKKLKLPEYTVCHALRIGREQKRKEDATLADAQ